MSSLVSRPKITSRAACSQSHHFEGASLQDLREAIYDHMLECHGRVTKIQKWSGGFLIGEWLWTG